MKRKLAALVGAGVIALALTGCIPGGVDENGNPAAKLKVPATVVFEQPVPDGGAVTCVASKYANSGGLSCDWYGYYQEHKFEEEE